MRGLSLLAVSFGLTACMQQGVGSPNEVADLGPAPDARGTCPDPAAPIGLETGDALASVGLLNCAGEPLDMQAIACDKKAAYFFVYADW